MTEQEKKEKIEKLKNIRKAYHKMRKEGTVHERALLGVHCMELQMRQEKLERGLR